MKDLSQFSTEEIQKELDRRTAELNQDFLDAAYKVLKVLRNPPAYVKNHIDVLDNCQFHLTRIVENWEHPDQWEHSALC
jgi:hypothetical protein